MLLTIAAMPAELAIASAMLTQPNEPKCVDVYDTIAFDVASGTARAPSAAERSETKP